MEEQGTIILTENIVVGLYREFGYSISEDGKFLPVTIIVGRYPVV